MLKIIINTAKVLFRKKSFIIMGIVAPAIAIVFFSFAFGNDMNYKIGIIDKDNTYTSKQIIDSVRKIENIDVVDISKENYEILLVSHQIQIAIIIEEDFQRKLLNLQKNKITIKSISNSDVKETLLSIIKTEINNLTLIGKVSNKNINEFIKKNEDYRKDMINCNLNDIKENKPTIENSIGIVIMMILISASNITNFLIEDEENNIKDRVLVSGIKQDSYYIALFIVFYLLSCISSIIYYVLCKVFKLDFGMNNSNYFFVVMLFINLVAISLNLCISSFTKNRYIASTVNILIIIPSCMISGVFWDFEVMPKYLRYIGDLMPQRWVYICIKRLQMYNDIRSIYQYIFYMIVLSIILFLLSLFMFKIKKSTKILNFRKSR